MARKNLTALQQDKAKLFFYELCYLAGVNRQAKIYDNMYRAVLAYLVEHTRSSEAQEIIQAFKMRQTTYKDLETLENNIKALANGNHGSGFLLLCEFGATAQYKWERDASLLCSFVAWICADKGWWWDDSKLSTYERDEILKLEIGSNLYNFKCFLSQRHPASTTTQSTTKATSSNTTTQPAASNSSGTTTNGPKNNYKSLGGLSGAVSNLISSQKTTLNGSVFCIEAEKTGANKRTLFITPLTSEGKPVAISAAQKIKLGSGNGYSDCQLWWSTLSDAQAALSKMSSSLPSEHFQIKKANPDSNGYFEVSTALGNAFIKASKLNEMLIEQINMDECNNIASRGYSIKDIDVFSEAFDTYGD